MESTRFEVWSGDPVLLSSDGLSDAIAETEIASVLDTFPGEPHKVVHALIAAALFMLIGADPRVEWLPEEIARDERGFVVAGQDLSRDGRTLGGRWSPATLARAARPLRWGPACQACSR